MKETGVIDMKVKAIFFLCYLTLLVSSVYGQGNSQSRSTISGFVFDQNRSPVSQIVVELLNDFNSVIGRIRTDGSGKFFFGGVGSGRFEVKVLPLGTNFEQQSQEVQLTGVSALGRPISDNIQIDIYLRPKKSPSTALPGTLFVQEVPDEAQKIYEKAISNLEAKKFDIGISELESALKIYPNYFLALERLGITYLNQQKYENARDIFMRAVAVNARSFNGWYGLAYTRYSLKQSKEAVEAAEKAVTLEPNSVNALLFLGLSLRQNKQYEKAEKSMKQAEKFANGQSPDVNWNLALLYAHNLKRYKDAANQLEIYLKATPNNPNAENIKKLIKQFREANLVSTN